MLTKLHVLICRTLSGGEVLTVARTQLPVQVSLSFLLLPPAEAAAAPPEPDEVFDNSTYKNYQHHSYTPHTFADLDVEMAKYRLPQPSSGRLSPRH